MQRNLVLSAVGVVLGLILIAVGVTYFAEPASSLPSFFPGQTAGSGHHHVKHGLAAVLLGLACIAYAWFSSAPKRA